MTLPDHKTKIVCTIGPSSRSIEVMEAMLRAGMNIARLNFSHADFATHARAIRDLREASARAERPVTIMADLPGPKMRIGQIAEGPVELRAGETVTLTTEDIVGDRSRFSVSFEQLPDIARPGLSLYLNDGTVQLEAVEVSGRNIRCRVIVGGEISSRKGLNIPGVNLGISAFTEHDRECLAFALAEGVESVGQSFVESAEDIQAVRRAAATSGQTPFIIAKIERSRALDRFDEILEAADGVMIARGDLGVEIPIEKMAVTQKHLMRKANLFGKPVITATQMLESMITSRIPTRAEATDVANAIIDGTDCVMLSGESAMGKFPVEAVRMLARIAAETEKESPRTNVREALRSFGREKKAGYPDLISMSLEAMLDYVAPLVIVVPTKSGATARNIARFKFPVWVAGISVSRLTCQHLAFSYGVLPVQEAEWPEDWNRYTRERLTMRGVEEGVAILIEGPSPKRPDANHRIEILDLRTA